VRNTRKSAKDKSKADAAPETADPETGGMPEPRDEMQAASVPEDASGNADPVPSDDAAPQEQTTSDGTEERDPTPEPDADAAEGMVQAHTGGSWWRNM